MKDKLGVLVTEIYSSGIYYSEAIEAFKKQYITHVLRSHNGNKFQSAIDLGMHRNTLDRTIAQLKLRREDWDPRRQLVGALPATRPVRPASADRRELRGVI